MRILKHDEDMAKKRMNAWWEGEIIDRPPVIMTAPKQGGVPYSGPDTDNLDDWWTNPSYVVPRWKHHLENTAWLGEAFPMVTPLWTRMVSITCQYLGAPNRYMDKQTTWSGPVIEDWETRAKLEIKEDNAFWVKTLTLIKEMQKMLKEEDIKAYLGIPDLNGPTEVLSGLRNPEKFAMDFYDCPEMIKPALREVQDAWFYAYETTSRMCHKNGGWFTWMKLWSDIPQVDLQSDVSCLLSKEMFDEYLLPFIREQTERIPRTTYHLDGPDAVRHLDSLLALPELDAVQWIHGAGNGPMLKWTDLLKRIQEAGKNLWILCHPWEIEPLLRELNPEGCLFVTEARTQDEGEELLEYMGRNWKSWRKK